MTGKNESHLNIEDLPQAEQDLTTEEAKEIKGGLLPAIIKTRESASEAPNVRNNNTYTGVLTL